MLLPLLVATVSAQSDPITRDTGNAFVYLTTPAGVTDAMPMIVLSFEVSRYANKVGSWSVTLPAFDRLDASGDPLGSSIVTGWKVSILQENNTPFGAASTWLLYRGIVERREYQVQDGGVVLALSGSFRESSLVREQIHDTLTYEDETAETIASSLAGEHVITPAISTATVKVDFNGGTKYAALLKVGELTRLTLRENWDGDALEFTAIDGAPDSGITLMNVEQVGPGMGY